MTQIDQWPGYFIAERDGLAVYARSFNRAEYELVMDLAGGFDLVPVGPFRYWAMRLGFRRIAMWGLRSHLDSIGRAMEPSAQKGSLRYKWLMARAGYAHSRHYELTVWEALVGAWGLFRDS